MAAKIEFLKEFFDPEIGVVVNLELCDCTADGCNEDVEWVVTHDGRWSGHASCDDERCIAEAFRTLAEIYGE